MEQKTALIVADVILIAHVAFVLYVTFGLVAI